MGPTGGEELIDDDRRLIAAVGEHAPADDPASPGREAERIEERVSRERLPEHVAIIMDGNGRWARRRGLARIVGHEKGAEALRRVTTRARTLGVREITFFALSTENFSKRARIEVNFLMRLLKKFLVSQRSELMDNQIRLRTIGEVEAFPRAVLETLRETERLTASNDAMVLRLALNYGARQEILRAVGIVVEDLIAGRLSSEEVATLAEKKFRRYLYDPDMSDPDLLIRTASEYRLSNFLLWQCSYSEIWVTDCLWPDFTAADFDAAVDSYVHRERKCGAVGHGGEEGESEAEIRKDTIPVSGEEFEEEPNR